jgi:membrane protease YdiL (CAAX protease family)
MPSRAMLYFLVITFLITWEIVGFYLLASQTATVWFGAVSGSHPLFFLATWAPAISAFALILGFVGMSGLRPFLTRLLLWRAPPGWVFFVLVGLPRVFVAGSLIKGGPVLAPLPPVVAGPDFSVMVMMLFLGPVEEFGWRGVLQPLLQRHVPPIWAGMLIGAIWGIWHFPAFFLAGTVFGGWNFMPFFVGNVVLAILVTPSLNRTGGSLLWPDAQPWDTWILAAMALVVV